MIFEINYTRVLSEYVYKWGLIFIKRLLKTRLVKLDEVDC